MTLDTGATTHAADRFDFPEQDVHESEGRGAGQTFGCAGCKKLANEGEVNFVMVAPGGVERELEATIQITKITRPLLSVSQMTKNANSGLQKGRSRHPQPATRGTGGLQAEGRPLRGGYEGAQSQV